MISNVMGLQSATLASNNAAYAMMRNSQARMDLAFGTGLGRTNLGDVFLREQALEIDNIQNHTSYLYNYYRQKALREQLDKNIKRSFSYFA